MKKSITLLAFLALVSFMFVGNAINYNKVQCSCCGGYGRVYTGYYDYYGNPIFGPCQCCQGTGYVLVPTNSYSPANKAIRTVTFRSANGGVNYGSGTFYENKMQVVSGGVYLNVSYSDSSKWKYMILFSNGQKWYFD